MSSGGAQFWFHQFIDSAGNPYSGVKLYHYAAGTTTNKDVWTDEGKTTAAAQPVVGDSSGMVSFYADGNYKFVIKDSADVTLYTWDNIKITSDDSTLWEGNAGTAYPTAATANRFQQFVKHNASNEIIEIGINKGAAFMPLTLGVYASAFSSFTDAVTAAANRTLIIDASINLPAGAITIPATVSVMPIQGGVINKSSATSLTINGPVVGNPMHQWLSGFAAGEVVFGAGSTSYILSEWYGIDGVADNTEIVLALSSSTKIPVKLLKRDYNTTGSITLTSGQSLIGHGDDSTYIKYTGSGKAILTDASAVQQNILLQDFSVSNQTNGTDGCDLSTMMRSVVRNVSIDGFKTNQCNLGGSAYGNYYNKFYDLTCYNTEATQTALNIGNVTNSTNANQFFGGLLWGVDAQRGTGLKITNGNGNRFYGTVIISQANAVILTVGVRNLIDVYIEACDAQGTIASGCRGNIFYKYLDGSATAIVDSDGRNLGFGSVGGGDTFGGLINGDLWIDANAPVKLDSTGVSVGDTGTAGKITLKRTSDGSGTSTITNNADVLEIDASGASSGDVKLIPGSSGNIQIAKALIALGGGAAPTLGTIGGSGPATAAQNTWLQLKDSTGATFWIPAWK